MDTSLLSTILSSFTPERTKFLHIAPQSTHAQDTDTGRSKPLLGIQPPEPDQSVVELGLLLADLGTVGNHVSYVV